MGTWKLPEQLSFLTPQQRAQLWGILERANTGSSGMPAFRQVGDRLHVGTKNSEFWISRGDGRELVVHELGVRGPDLSGIKFGVSGSGPKLDFSGEAINQFKPKAEFKMSAETANINGSRYSIDDDGSAVRLFGQVKLPALHAKAGTDGVKGEATILDAGVGGSVLSAPRAFGQADRSSPDYAVPAGLSSVEIGLAGKAGASLELKAAKDALKATLGTKIEPTVEQNNLSGYFKDHVGEFQAETAALVHERREYASQQLLFAMQELRGAKTEGAIRDAHSRATALLEEVRGHGKTLAQGNYQGDSQFKALDLDRVSALIQEKAPAKLTPAEIDEAARALGLPVVDMGRNSDALRTAAQGAAAAGIAGKAGMTAAGVAMSGAALAAGTAGAAGVSGPGTATAAAQEAGAREQQADGASQAAAGAADQSGVSREQSTQQASTSEGLSQQSQAGATAATGAAGSAQGQAANAQQRATDAASSAASAGDARTEAIRQEQAATLAAQGAAESERESLAQESQAADRLRVASVAARDAEQRREAASQSAGEATQQAGAAGDSRGQAERARDEALQARQECESLRSVVESLISQIGRLRQDADSERQAANQAREEALRARDETRRLREEAADSVSRAADASREAATRAAQAGQAEREASTAAGRAVSHV